MHVLGVSGAETAAGTHRGHRRRLTWRRLPILLELITLGAAYGAPSLVRVVLTTTKSVAFAHALQLYRAENTLGLNIEPWLNHLVAPHDLAAVAVGYYYGLLHFILTPLTLAWLYWYRPRAFPRLRSALVLSTIGANIVFWTWPVAPPRFAIPGLVDILAAHNVLDSADPHGVTGAANLYAALPSLHVCWATWCAVAVVTATRSRWRYLAWLYPAATTFVVLASANHFVFDVAGGVAVTVLGLAVSRISIGRKHHPVPEPVPVPESEPVPESGPVPEPVPVPTATPAVVSAAAPRGPTARRATAILTCIGAAAIDGASVSAVAFGALVGVPIPVTAAGQNAHAPGAQVRPQRKEWRPGHRPRCRRSGTEISRTGHRTG
ncbi:MAG TPA: phosphatase PAP2 family protein [Streptosporangiaceae bacterium]|jgi:hypothetical protein